MSWDNYDEHCNDHYHSDPADCEYCIEAKEEERMEQQATEADVCRALRASIKERLMIAKESVTLDTPKPLRERVTDLRHRYLPRLDELNRGDLMGLYLLSGEVVEQVAHGRAG